VKPDEMINYTLKKLQEGLIVGISKAELDTCNISPSATIDLYTGNLLMKVTKRVPAEVQNEYDETVEFEVPLTWFDHLKKDIGLAYKTKKLTRFIHFECGWKYPKLARHLKMKKDEYEKYIISSNLPPFGEEE